MATSAHETREKKPAAEATKKTPPGIPLMEVGQLMAGGYGDKSELPLAPVEPPENWYAFQKQHED
jgi:hypothetical protein